jgi:hypothetical protein
MVLPTALVAGVTATVFALVGGAVAAAAYWGGMLRDARMTVLIESPTASDFVPRRAVVVLLLPAAIIHCTVRCCRERVAVVAQGVWGSVSSTARRRR